MSENAHRGVLPRHRRPPRLWFGFAIAFLVVFAGAAGQAAPKKELWERWAAHAPNSKALIDHRFWDNFLRRNVLVGGDGVNRIDYANVPRAERAGLKSYMDFLSAVPISRYNRFEQLAYWINLYNALTVRLVIEHSPVESIRDIDISPGFFADGPWGKKLVPVEGVPVSLDDIEHRILRPIWNDNRIHYAVNCASLGCPNLQPTAFNGRNVHALLEAAAKEFVNHPRAVAFEDDALTVSRIYDWFREDFGDNDERIIAHLWRFAGAGIRKRLEERQEIDGYQYDWRVNGGRL
jgi:hypothetical protein